MGEGEPEIPVFTESDDFTWFGVTCILILLTTSFTVLYLIYEDFKEEYSDKTINYNDVIKSIGKYDLVSKFKNVIKTRRWSSAPAAGAGAGADADAHAHGASTVAPPPPPPPKTCADINGTPETPVAHTCPEQLWTLSTNPESIGCLNSGCSNFICCTTPPLSETCSPGFNGGVLPALSSLGTTETIVGTGAGIQFSDTLPSGISPDDVINMVAPTAGTDYNLRLDLTGIVPDDVSFKDYADYVLTRSDYPKFIPCQAGYKNTPEYAALLRLYYPNEQFDYEKTTVVNCGIDNHLQFGEGCSADGQAVVAGTGTGTPNTYSVTPESYCVADVVPLGQGRSASGGSISDAQYACNRDSECPGFTYFDQSQSYLLQTGITGTAASDGNSCYQKV